MQCEDDSCDTSPGGMFRNIDVRRCGSAAVGQYLLGRFEIVPVALQVLCMEIQQNTLFGRGRLPLQGQIKRRQ